MKKKILLGILPSYSVGGAEKVMMGYLKGTDARPFHYKMFVSNKQNKSKNKNINIHEFNYKRFLYAMPKLLLTVKELKVSIIFSTFPHITVMIILAKLFRLHNCKIVVRQPNMLMPSLSASIKLRLVRLLYLKTINFADIIIVTSRAMKKEAQSNKLKRDKLFMLGNPIDVKGIRRNLIPRRTEGKELKIIYVGRLTYQKGLDRVLNVFSKLDNIEFIIIGEGEQKEYLKDICKKKNIEKKINFFGFLRNPSSMIAGADYFLLPSRWEGMPNCVLESLALGTPIISFKNLEVFNDFKFNIKNKTVTLTQNNDTLIQLLKTLKRRSDYLNPRLRKNLLNTYLSEKSYQKKLDDFIVKSLCKK